MTAEDLKGCLRKLDSSLRAIKYPRDVDYNGLSKGTPSAFLPILDFTLTSFSPLLTATLVTADFQLTGKTDLRFTDTVYKVLRDVFHYKPVLSKQQFLQCGYSQRKISVTCDIINLVLQRHNQLKKSKTRPSHPLSVSSVEVPQPRTTNNPVYVVSHIGEPSPSTSCTEERPSVAVVSHIGEPSPSTSCTEERPSVAVVSHIGEPSPSTSCTEERTSSVAELGRKEDKHLPNVLEDRVFAIEARLESLLPALEKLTALEMRLENLETLRDTDKNQAFVTIPKETWHNLLSRVTLLETSLQLTRIQRDSLGDEMTSVPIPSPSSNPPQEDLNERLERITRMMNNTSSLLKSADVSI